jgi:SAM-dependent methyltransferase
MELSVPASLKAHKADWEELAALDPLWAILVREGKRGNKWDAEEFFRTGKNEIDGLMAEVGSLSEKRGKALDFGCGVGRLTRGLTAYYDEAYGVDISERMIEKAREFSAECKFRVNDSEDLAQFSDEMFDLVYTNRVLQHMPSPAIIGNYLKEFFRITAPGGLVVFQAPSRKSLRNILNLKRSLYHVLKTVGLSSEVVFERLKLHPMRMTAIAPRKVREIVTACDGELVQQRRDNSAHFAVFYVCRRLPSKPALRVAAGR